MTPREKLRTAYELAFHPPRLNQAWNRIKRNGGENLDEWGELLDMAILLHQALPEEGVASHRALKRLALYQARARSFGMVRFLTNLRVKLGRKDLPARTVPAWMVRDIDLPPLAHKTNSMAHPLSQKSLMPP
jgi:hypothetical protein